jgi:mRNA capping enzyme, beta chain
MDGKGGVDGVWLQHVSRMLQYIRSHTEDKNTFELELRVGQIRMSSNTFESGYREAHMGVIKCLIERFDAQVKKEPDAWSSEPQCKMIRAHYQGSLRKTCIPDINRTEYHLKCGLSSLWLECVNREYDVRVNLSLDSPLDPLDSRHTGTITMINTSKPLHVRLLRRASYRWVVKSCLLQPSQEPLQIQFDISKATAPAANKEKATQTEVRYQCEVELASTLSRLATRELEDAENQRIAYVLLSAVRLLLGTHVKGVNGTWTALPMPQFVLVREDTFDRVTGGS